MTNGILNILKPPGMTSHDVVSRVRKKTGIKRVGHAGTLDPEAAGVLPICVGSATRLIQFMDHRRKIYRAEMRLGVETTTQDMTGELVRQNDLSKDLIPKRNELIEGLKAFVGEYHQTPPMYSSIKKNGRKLYEIAREGKEIEREARIKHIHTIDRIQINGTLILFDVSCSEGTYVRTLCHDAGQKLGCGAALSFLLRIESCRLRLENSITLEELQAADNWTAYRLSPDVPLDHLPKAVINPQRCREALNGNPISMTDITISSETMPQNEFSHHYRLYINDQFLGIGEMQPISALMKFKMKFSENELK